MEPLDYRNPNTDAEDRRHIARRAIGGGATGLAVAVTVLVTLFFRALKDTGFFGDLQPMPLVGLWRLGVAVQAVALFGFVVLALAWQRLRGWPFTAGLLVVLPTALLVGGLPFYAR